MTRTAAVASFVHDRATAAHRLVDTSAIIVLNGWTAVNFFRETPLHDLIEIQSTD
jgi:hypothetical protein